MVAWDSEMEALGVPSATSENPYGNPASGVELSMTRYIKLAVCLIAVLCAAVSLAQVSSTPIEASVHAPTGPSPIAFVYVSNSLGANNYEINAFAVAANGKLTPVTGSPFAAHVQNMAVNGKYLFGTDGVYIYSFSIASDGALQETASINAQQLNGGCGGPLALFLDHTGATLYDEDYDGNECANTSYQSFSIDQSTGQLSYLGMTSAASPSFNEPLSFIGNNLYAYGASCYRFGPSIFGFTRNSDATLTFLNISPPMPEAKAGDGYCPWLAAADPKNHLAVSVQAIKGGFGGPDGPPQLATYTADGSGNLTTKSTFSNMPTAWVKSVTDISMSPSGKLLAVAGTGGLQVFHFNGRNPITHYTGLLTKAAVANVDQMFWDNDDHLYAISQSAGKLFVFTITPTSVKRAPGSPYPIANPQNIIVLPKT